MPLAFAGIAPHGFPLIPLMSDDADGALQTRTAMEELGRRCAAADVDVIVLAGPHGVRVAGTVCLAEVARAAGTLRWAGHQVEMNVPVDASLTAAVAQRAEGMKVPIARAAYAGNRPGQAVIPLDWGAITPLWFLGHDHDMTGSGDALAAPPDADPGPPVVLITPARDLPRSTLVTFGRAVAEAAHADPRRVAFVASCDWAHTHRDDGPYGFHPAAAEVDAMVVGAVRDNDLQRLMDLDETLANEAAIDGLWQALMLAGAQQVVPMAVELLSYEAPTYYGMLVAAYSPTMPL